MAKNEDVLRRLRNKFETQTLRYLVKEGLVK